MSPSNPSRPNFTNPFRDCFPNSGPSQTPAAPAIHVRHPSTDTSPLNQAPGPIPPMPSEEEMLRLPPMKRSMSAVEQTIRSMLPRKLSSDNLSDGDMENRPPLSRPPLKRSPSMFEMWKDWRSPKADDVADNFNGAQIPSAKGYADRFLKNPMEFLKDTVILESMPLMKGRETSELWSTEKSKNPLFNPGLIDFQLIPLTVAPEKAIQLTPVLGQAAESTQDGATIKAHWLPWKPGAAMSMTLGKEADVFFTSQLGGCRLHIDMTDPCAPKVVHVAGTRDPDATNPNASSEWKDERAKEELGDAYDTSFRLSLTKGEHPHRYEGEGLNVVGARNPADGKWEFWAQQCDVESLEVKSSWKLEHKELPPVLPEFPPAAHLPIQRKASATVADMATSPAGPHYPTNV